jgi:hypothetical protein
LSLPDVNRTIVSVKIKDLSTTAVLGIAGALTIVAAIFIFLVPPETVNAIAQQIGLQDPQVGLMASEPANTESAGPSNRKSQSNLAALSSLSGAKKVSLAAGAPARSQSEIVQGSSPDLKSETAKSDLTVPKGERQAVIKATSMEEGHLVEKYMYLNGGMVLFVDGQLSLEHLPHDPRN